MDFLSISVHWILRKKKVSRFYFANNLMFLLEIWRKKTIKDIESSTLLCLPEYGTNQYEFSVSTQNSEVTHSPSSLQTIEQRCWYEKYIPEDLRHPSTTEEGEE